MDYYLYREHCSFGVFVFITTLTSAELYFPPHKEQDVKGLTVWKIMAMIWQQSYM